METKRKAAMPKGSVVRLTVTAILLALSTVLSMLKVFELPFGGSITLCSMLPMLMVGLMFGPKWGLAAGAVNGVLQAVLGATTSGAFASQGALNVVLICLIDYLLAFMVLGLSAMFLKGEKHRLLKAVCGSVVAMLLRYVCHVVSGFLLFGSWAEWFFSQEGFYSWGQKILENFSGNALSLIYSLIYNAAYMIPEIIITTVALAVLLSIKPISKQIVGSR